MSNSRADIEPEATHSEPDGIAPMAPWYAAAGELLFRVATVRGQIAITRWNATSKTWISLELITRGRPHTEHRSDGANHANNGVGARFAAYQSPDEAFPQLYTSAYSPSGVSLAVLSSDLAFHKAGSRRSRPASLGPLLVWRDRLVGADGRIPRIWTSKNPLGSEWTELAIPDWAERGNLRITHLAALDGSLFVVMENQLTGFEVWRCSDERGDDWKPVVICGAYRFRRNPTVMAVALGDGHLILAAGPEDPDPFGRARPTGFEILAIDTAGRWSVLAGDCRFTPYGLHVPLWALSPGLGVAEDHRVTGLASGEKGIYVMTAQRRVWCLSGPDECEQVIAEGERPPDSLVTRNGSPLLIGTANGRLHLQALL